LQVFKACGEVLSTIHAASTCGERWVQALTGCSNCGPTSPSTSVLLHGDFGFSNVHYRIEHGGVELLVLDPGPNRVTVTTPTAVGHPVIDLAVMTSCLLGRVGLRRLARLPAIPRGALLRAFYDGYIADAQAPCTFPDMLAEGSAMLDGYLRKCRGWPKFAADVVVRGLCVSAAQKV
jgi:hypothetical protein